MLDITAPSAEETARKTAETWIHAFDAAVRHGDGPAQTGLFTSTGAFSQARIYSCYIALQIDALERGRLAKVQDKAQD